MKNMILSFILLSFGFLFISCDDTFSPKGEFQEGYTLYCVLDGNSSHQEAYLLRNYNPEGLNAEEYNLDRTVTGAQIKISNGSTELQFDDTTEFNESLGYSVSYYKIENFIPSAFLNQTVTITAQTPDGKLLTGNTNIDTKHINFSASTKKELPYDVSDSLRILFLSDGLFQFTPFLLINYREIINGDTSYNKKEVPFDYAETSSGEISIYPDYKLRNRYSYPIANIAYELKKIANAKNPADRIKILNLTLGILQVTNPLDIYYKTYKTFSDGFSIKTQEPNITNIQNANGIFAFKSISSINILFRRDWNNYFANLALEQL